ncbi:Protein turtle B [Amphibalanus amphitrite]|uniref:Protein turtle B n=1 Tax=Amphibalanus amphitrite TaxID=1232801 RepID=A0A6A4VP87_AMPAM|nr:Protein turtle B [Amphibalanus amphitrite]
MAPSAVLLLCLTMAAGTAAAEVAPTADVAADLEAPPPVSEGELPFLDYEDPPEDPAGDELTAEVTDPAGEEPGPEIVEGEQPAVVEDDGLEDDDILKDQPDDAASETQEKSEDAAGLAEEKETVELSEVEDRLSHEEKEEATAETHPEHSKEDADDDTADSGEQLPSELWSPSIHVAAVEVGSAEPVRDESAAPASLQAPSSGTFDSSALASAPVEFSVKEGGSLILPCGSAMMTKSSVRWYRSGRPLFQGQSSLSADGRLHLLADGSLRLTSASTQDDGMFTCRAYGDEGAFTETSHRVHVRSREEALKEEAGRTLGSAPSLQVVTEPADGVRIVERDEATSLSCWAPGQPRATVTWTKQEGNLPYGESMLRGPRLDIGKVMPAHRGTYRCTVTTADNRTETRTLLLQVNFAPEVTAPEPEVHSGEDHQAVLNCRVEAHPPAKVHWRRTSGRPLRPGHHLQTQEDGMFRLTMLVESEDLDTYVCEAENSLGRAEAPVVLTGRPGRPVVTSPARGSESETYTLRWWDPSFPPLMAYKLIYRRRIVNGDDAER